MSEKKKSGGALLGAAFLMATSAIGPGFLTQTATFTGQYQESFGFVILVSVILAAIAQLNIWRVLCVTGLRGQDVSNKVLPGLGYLVSMVLTHCLEYLPKLVTYWQVFWQSWYLC